MSGLCLWFHLLVFSLRCRFFFVFLFLVCVGFLLCCLRFFAGFFLAVLVHYLCFWLMILVGCLDPLLRMLSKIVFLNLLLSFAIFLLPMHILRMKFLLILLVIIFPFGCLSLFLLIFSFFYLSVF